jgi:hypothetical protein
MRKFLSLIFAIVLFLPSSSFAAIAFDNSADGSTATASFSTSYTVSGSNTLLVVTWNAGGTSASTFTGGTYGGQALTSIGFIPSHTGDDSVQSAYLLGAPTGSNTLTLNWSSNTGTIFVAIASYNGVSQVGFPDATGTGSPGTNSTKVSTFTGSITPSASNVWGIMVGQAGSTAVTAGTNTKVREDEPGSITTTDTNGANTGTFSLEWTFSGSGSQYSALYFSIAPVGAVVTVTPNPFTHAMWY